MGSSGDLGGRTQAGEWQNLGLKMSGKKFTCQLRTLHFTLSSGRIVCIQLDNSGVILGSDLRAPKRESRRFLKQSE